MELFLENEIELCVSKDMMTEYFEVLNRKKFARYPDFKIKADSILAHIANSATFFSPKKKLKIIDDDADNKLLELAHECKADFIVTGNTNDFTFPKYKKTRIVSPREFWELFRPSE